MKITNADHLLLLGWLNNFGVSPSKPRTDNIAKSLGWTNQHMPCIGLELRALGFVSSSNDGKQYNYWRITQEGTQRLLSHRKAVAQEMKTKREAAEPSKSKPFLGFMVVAYQDGGELSSVFSSKKEADALADKWAKESPGVAYYVVGVMDKVKADVVLTRE
ncbi:hypothetical protein Luutsna3_00010 [Pseudomonas phage vB_PpuP-Luutsna-3]